MSAALYRIAWLSPPGSKPWHETFDRENNFNLASALTEMVLVKK